MNTRIIRASATLLVALALATQPLRTGAESDTNRTISATFTFSAPTIEQTPDSCARVTLGDLPRLTEPGLPALPYRLAHLVLPAGATVREVLVETGEPTWLPAPAAPELAHPQVPISLSQSPVPNRPAQIAFDQTPYPSRNHDLLSEQYLDGYRLLRLRLYPVRYDPARRAFGYVKNMRVVVHLSETAADSSAPSPKAHQRRVSALVDNPHDLASITPRLALLGRASASLVDPAQPCDYLIVTSRALHAAFEPLASWRRGQGLAAAIYDIEDILAIYDGVRPSGGSDDATCLREFLADAYTAWADSAHPLRYVLLSGDSEIIPARQVFVRAGIYETSDSLPLVSDAYYAGLDGSWDADADGLYGEGATSEGGAGQAGEEADLYAELYIGRAPVNELIGDDVDQQARQWVAKVLAYEADPTAEYLDRAVWLGEKLDNTTYGDDSVELTVGVAQALNIQRMYDSVATWTDDDLTTALNAGVHVVNHLGHASATRVLRMNSADVAALTNERPFLVHSQGCLAAAFTTRAGEAIAEQFVTAEHGALAFIGNTSYGWYMPNSTNGASQIFDDAFFDALFREGIAKLGPALQDAKEDSLALVGAVGPERWVYLELTLLGDPYTPIVNRYADPLVHIASPSRATRLAGSVAVNGSARVGSAESATFESYGLYWGEGYQPEAWTAITPNTSAPVKNSLLGIWDTGLLSDGRYTLRLAAKDTHGLQSVEDLVVEVDHTHLIAPRANAYYRAGDTLSISGTASCASFAQYTLCYAAPNAPDEWTTIAISTAPVVSNTLAEWDTSAISLPGEYRLRLAVQGGDYEGEDELDFVLDPAYTSGWPRAIPNRLSNESPAIADLDGDGSVEIVASEGMRVCGGALEGGRCGGYGMMVYVWDTLGDLRPGWPRMPGSDNWLTAPALADLDGDRTLEVIIGSVDGRVYAYHHNGELATGWPQFTSAEIFNAPACGDVDGDGQAEVVACDNAGKVYAWRGDGSLLQGWPRAVLGAGASPLLADLSGDPALEVIVADASGRISAWGGDGSPMVGWPVDVGRSFLAAPAAGDLDNDGRIEIVAPAEDGLYMWRADGSPAPGWPQPGAMGSQGSSPALADLDGDGKLEIIMAGRAGGVRVYRYDGQVMPGWTGYEPLASRSSPVVGDMDGDDDPEVIVVGDDTQPWIYAFHHDGSAVSGWPRRIPKREMPYPYWDRRSSATLAELDGDGLLELAVGVERYVFAWDLAGASDHGALWPTFRGNVQRTGSLAADAAIDTGYLPLLISGSLDSD